MGTIEGPTCVCTSGIGVQDNPVANKVVVKRTIAQLKSTHRATRTLANRQACVGARHGGENLLRQQCGHNNLNMERKED